MSFQNECSFVSLRDVERAMKVIMWFYTHSKLIDEVVREEGHDTGEEQGKPVRTWEMAGKNVMVSFEEHIKTTYI